MKQDMIVIRKANAADILSLADLFDLYRVFYNQASDIAAANKFLKDRFANNESVILVAEQDHTLVGFTQLYPIFSSVSLLRAWLLNDLYVHANARKKGIAGLLLGAAREHGLQTDAKYLLLETAADNFTAQSVYEKNGWKKTSGYFYELGLTLNS
jgi:GNAT superfamily N-acetyltransferase